MPAKKGITLDDILAQKRRKDASNLASAIMGKRKKAEPPKPAPGSGIKKAHTPKKAIPTGPSASTPDRWQHDLHHHNNPAASRVSKASKVPGATISPGIARSLQNNKLFAALHSDQVDMKTGPVPTGPGKKRKGTPTGPAASLGLRPQQQQQAQQQAQIRGLASGAGGNGFSIRGSAGPTVVHASNFAPGTTAEDIRHAMAPLGTILNCIILSAQPTVIAEIVFEKKETAERCIQQYNNQRADGRLLHIYLKNGPPTARIPAKAASYTRPNRSPSPGIDPYRQREEADRLRREANVVFQDGRYGVKPPPLYSDVVMQKGRGFGY